MYKCAMNIVYCHPSPCSRPVEFSACSAAAWPSWLHWKHLWWAHLWTSRSVGFVPKRKDKHKISLKSVWTSPVMWKTCHLYRSFSSCLQVVYKFIHYKGQKKEIFKSEYALISWGSSQVFGKGGTCNSKVPSCTASNHFRTNAKACLPYSCVFTYL